MNSAVQNIEAMVRAYFKDTLGQDVGSFPASESLLEAGVIDSLGVQSLVEFVSERFAVEVSEDDLVPENFDSIDAITSFIRRSVGELDA